MTAKRWRQGVKETQNINAVGKKNEMLASLNHHKKDELAKLNSTQVLSLNRQRTQGIEKRLSLALFFGGGRLTLVVPVPRRLVTLLTNA